MKLHHLGFIGGGLMWWIQGLIFGYAKEFEKERKFINWEIGFLGVI